jgi:alanyl aminopeptidase
LTTREDSMPLAGSCPDWVMPNADAAGYYRFAIGAEDNGRLMADGFSRLSAPERLAVADSLRGSFRAGAASSAQTFAALAPLATDESRAVAIAPMSLVRQARDHLVGEALRPAVEDFASRLYASQYDDLGWREKPGEGGERALRREAIVTFLARVARDPSVRSDGVRLAERYLGLDGAPPDTNAIAPDLIKTALSVAVQENGTRTFAALLLRGEGSDDAVERGRLLGAMGAARDPNLIARARDLSLDPRLRTNEATRTLRELTRHPETLAETWDWIETHFDPLVERLGVSGAGGLPWLASGFCSEARAASLKTFLEPRVEHLRGGPRNLAGSLEAIRLCAVSTSRHSESAQNFFASEQRRAR